MTDVPSNLIPTRITQLPDAPVASADSLLLVVYQGNTYKVRAGDLVQISGVPTSRQVIAGTGMTGGGQLTSNVTLSIANGGVGSTQLNTTGVAAGVYGDETHIPVLTVDVNGRVTAATTVAATITGYVPTSREVIAGNGLTGGGALSSSVTLSANLSSSTPLSLDGTGSAGVSTAVSRADHTHPAVDLADSAQVDGILPVDQGGTSRSLVMEAGAIIYSGADGLYVGPAGVPGQVLVSNGSNEYTWGSAILIVDQPANYVYAGPESGPDAPTGFRLLVNADIPTALSGKAIDGSVIGGTTPAAGSFTDLNAEQIDMDTTVTGITDVEGRVYWNSADNAKTLNIGMAGGAVVQQVGEETFFRIKASSAITNGQTVMFTGTVGASGGLTGAPATGLTAETASYFMGVATEDIALNGWGYVTHFGVVRGIDTTGGAESWVDGQILYFDPTVAGGLTKNVPVAPAPKIQAAAVLYAAANGSLFVRPSIYPSITQLGDVESTSPTTNDLLQYTAGGYWTHSPASTISVGEATNVAGGAANQVVYQTTGGATGFVAAPTVAGTALTWSGTAFEWVSSGTVTSVGASVPVGFTVTGSPVTSSGTLAIAFDTGYALPTTASQTNWDTAYSERLQWDGGATGLVAATGRTSLGLGSAAVLTAGVAGGVATLDGGGTVPTSQLPAAVLGAVKYQGTWNASTNTPTLTSSVGTQGYYYVVSVAGTTNLDGVTDWKVGDWAIYNGTAWEKIDNTDAVTSVNGYTGTVVLNYADVGAPATDGTGATGSWGISVTGTAAALAGGAASQIPYQTGAGVTNFIANGAAGQVLLSNGASAPTWGSMDGGTF